MSDDVPLDGLGDKVEPTDPNSIQYLGRDGEWHLIPVEPKRTGDPELDAIWEMSFKELEQILKDESHPLHEKAKQVSSEITKPVADALADTLRELKVSFSTTIDTLGPWKALTVDRKALLPALNSSSWFARLPLELPKSALAGLVGEQNAAAAVIERPDALTTMGQGWIDLDAIEPPDASAAEIQEAAEARAREIRKIEILNALLDETQAAAESGKEALELSRDSLREAKSAKRAGWIAVWVAIIAALISVGGIVAAVLLAA